MPLTFGSFLFRRSPSVDATLSAVVAHAVYRDIFHARVVDVVDYRDVDIVHRPVVEKVSVVPTAAFIAMPEVTEAVADAAIETDSGTPITFMKNESRAAPAPPGRGPQETYFGGENPGAGNPVIVVAIPGPVAGRPDVTIAGAKGLFINRQFRGSVTNGNDYTNLRERRGGTSQEPKCYHQCNQQETKRKQNAHDPSFLP